MKLFKIVTGIFFTLFVLSVQAGTTYTPSELRSMVQSGNYPAQGTLNRQETSKMEWLACLARTEAIIGAMIPEYPAVSIVNTNLITSTKVWVNDAAITVTCYADGRLLITSAPYL